MKKVLAVLVSAMLALAMAACVSREPEIQKPTEVTTETEQVETEPETQEPASTPEPETESELAAEPATTPEPEPATTPMPTEEATVEEAVIVDAAGVKVTVKSLDENASWYGPALKLLIENDSGKDLTVQCRNSSVNGYMCETMMSTDVANGKKANDTLTFDADQLALSGVDAIAEMEFSLHIFDADTWDTYFDTDPIVVKTSLAGTFEQEYDDSGDVAYSSDGIYIIVKGLTDEASWLGKSVMVEIINATDTDFTVQCRDTSINGFMVSDVFSCDVCAGKRAIDDITFASYDLEENDIETIEDVELSFHVFDMDSWDTIVDTDVVRITF